MDFHENQKVKKIGKVKRIGVCKTLLFHSRWNGDVITVVILPVGQYQGNRERSCAQFQSAQKNSHGAPDEVLSVRRAALV